MQAHIFISGFVQAVGFRAFVKAKAEEYGIGGWAKNTDDGRVEALLQGNEDNINKVIEACNKGPFLSEVRDVVVEWEEGKKEFSDFQIVH